MRLLVLLFLVLLASGMVFADSATNTVSDTATVTFALEPYEGSLFVPLAYPPYSSIYRPHA